MANVDTGFGRSGRGAAVLVTVLCVDARPVFSVFRSGICSTVHLSGTRCGDVTVSGGARYASICFRQPGYGGQYPGDGTGPIFNRGVK